MDVLIVVLIFLFVLVVVVTVVGHLIWVGVRALIRWMFDLETQPETSHQYSYDPVTNRLRDLETTEKQIVRFYRDAQLNDETYERVMKQIRAERVRLVQPETTRPQEAPRPPTPKPGRIITLEPTRPESVVTPDVPIPAPEAAPSVVTASFAAPDDEVVVEPVPSFKVADDEPEPEPRFEEFTPPPPPRRPFSEVLNSFMEESNIRWGEIIGGLLIIGCSTALVVSLWAQISEIPVLKFLIFTTVTAVLFGIGLYTDHRWKLPTTSRGILTIATLLVPLNFLAIAAVSAGNTPGALVLGSELAAPAIFLCLVYFAGRVITPSCAHILAAGVLGSSVGQLLVRHFASVDAPPVLLIFLGAFPVLFYVVTVGLALRFVLHDRQIDERETTTVFTILGAMSFAALLPFGLLLYKSGPMSLSMMYLAPIVTLWGVPLVATGTILWRRISNKEMVAARTTGTALGILGAMIVLAGMFLAWPNPSSIVPAALFNFAVFTTLAIALRLPAAHLLATICFALAYLVTFHVFAGDISWVNLRVMSLLDVSLSVSSGQALVGAFALFLAASEWLERKGRQRDSFYYFASACFIAVLSLALASLFGLLSLESHALWVVYGLYSLGAFWIAWRHRLVQFTWIGSALLLFCLAHSFSQLLGFSFPWQTAFFAHATICAIAAIISSRYARGEVFAKTLNHSALISIVLGVVSLFQANTWEVTWMQAQRVFWIAAILLLLLWLNRRRLIFNAFQIALVCGLVLTVKAALQQFIWYSYLPHAFLHPTALQIQGTVLALFCLIWLALRFLVKRALPKQDGTWLNDAWHLLDTRYSIDRIISWSLLGAFLLLAIYGALSGVTQELAALGSGYKGLNLAEFPHDEALGLGSWIVLGLLLLIMLGNFWDRRSGKYLLGTLAVLAAIIPLLAGLFENQIATATAWRFLAAIFFACASLVIWYRSAIAQRLKHYGWPDLGEASVTKEAIALLIALTVVPLILLTLYPAWRAIYYLPVQSPISGLFSFFGDDVSYGVPLVLAALVMIGHALRERMIDFAFYGGVLFNLTVTLAFLLAIVSGNGLMDRVVLVRLAQLNAITCAVYLLSWLSTRPRWQSGLNESDLRSADYLLKLQLGIVVVLNLVLFAPVIVNLIVAPASIAIGTIAAGSFLGWLAFLISVVAVVWFASRRSTKVSADLVAGLLLGISCLAAFSVSSIDGWLALHWLTVCTVAVAWLMLAASELSANESNNVLRHLIQADVSWREHALTCAAIIGGIAVFLSLRSLADDYATHWWSTGPLLAITILFATLNWKTQRRRYIYAAGILFNLAVSVWWLLYPRDTGVTSDFFLINVIAGSLAGILWVWLDLRSRKLGQVEHRRAPSFHDFAALFALVLLTLIVFVGSLAPPQISPLLQTPLLTWGAFLALLAFMTACLWDKGAKYAVAGLYFLGLLAGGIALGQSPLTETGYTWSITIFLAVYTLGVALMWHWRERLIEFAGQFGIPRRIGAEVSGLVWLSAFTAASVVLILTLSYWITLNFLDFGLRASVALAVAIQFLTFGFLAEREERWRQVALVVLIVGAVLFGWSWLTPGSDATWLNRSVILMLEAFGLIAIYGLFLDRVNTRWPQWTGAAKSFVPWLVGAGALALLFCLGTEVSYQINFGAVNIHPVSLVTIGLTLVAAVVLCVLFALSPNHDPLGLSEQQRTRYVYAGEVLLVLLFLHIRLTLPWLFTGFLERYWPLVVMVVAYFGVVASETLRRNKLFVLAHPLERTGAFLPLLPVLGFWIVSSEVDFSMLLFVIGGLYGLLSILRRSFLFGVLAAVAGNAGLWYAFNRTADYGLLQHPQLWLIPVAVSVLIAAYLNEDKLDEDQLTGVRYLSLITIYVSSTADIFINGAANSPWLPLILGTLSLAGIFAGIVFRIRGLLLLGAIFLLLSIITMIWYASVNLGWTWLWYVAGIVTGATIIFMFALFEKKRSEVLRVVEGLKEWDR